MWTRVGIGALNAIEYVLQDAAFAGNEALKTYATRSHSRVHGWLTREAIALTLATFAMQHDFSLNGSVAEIGVHHGRLLILLGLARARADPLLAIDLFGQQEENTSRSGRGSLARFQENLGLHAQGSGDDCIILEANSMKLNSEDLLNAVNRQKFRLFSVDGGHTAECAQHDMTIAFGSLTDGGVVVLDDYFNYQWPGVSEGVMRFALANEDNVIPFAIGGNKVLFTTSREWHSRYLAAIRERLGIFRSKKSRFLGVEVFVLEEILQRHKKAKGGILRRTGRSIRSRLRTPRSAR
ncbi:MAG TPA: class I SAM-dependent methyltransferase [Rhodothermales bacterium]|nr:class I SAM-dependent methyltransferase [Rhodothermales bacterium]